MNDSDTSDIDHSVPSPSAHPKSTHRLVHLDGWRGLCILAVLAGHFLPFHAVDFGSLGVEMFFVLSGRLMADILFVEKFPLPAFYLRRFSRVWPGLAVYVAFCAVMFSGVLFARVPAFLHVTPASIVAALTFLSNYRIMLLGETQLLDHTWSLAVEEHSYLVLGVLAFMLRRQPLHRVKHVILALALAMVLNGLAQAYLFPPKHVIFAPGHGYPAVLFDVYWRSDIRAASVFFSAFVYLHFFTRGSSDLPRWVCLAAALTGLAAFYAGDPEGVSFTIGTLCLAVSVNALDGARNPFQALLRNRVLVAFGLYSYSIYLWQQIFYKLFQFMRDAGILSPVAGLVFRPAFIAGACAAGVLSYYFVENPARRYLNGLLAARPGFYSRRASGMAPIGSQVALHAGSGAENAPLSG